MSSGTSAGWVLAGDIGGNRARLGLFAENDGVLTSTAVEDLDTADFDEPEDLLGAYLERAEVRPVAACLGLAGPVLNGRCRMTNIDWIFESEFLAQHLGVRRLDLLNDLEAMALGLDDLPAAARQVLRQGRPQGTRRVGLLAVDSGLGEAARLELDGRVAVLAGEGGHADFAATSERDWQLQQRLAEQFGGHVSWERVLSGAGLVSIYELLCEQAGRAPVTVDAADAAEVVMRRGLEAGDSLCHQALRWFVGLLAAEAGNLALRGLCADGIYLGGAWPVRLHKLLQEADFAEAFAAKGRFRKLLEQVPLYLVNSDDAALFGAARHALRAPATEL